jgi:hypothetical protein
MRDAKRAPWTHEDIAGLARELFVASTTADGLTGYGYGTRASQAFDAAAEFAAEDASRHEAMLRTDVTKCPGCGGEADNGHDRSWPPVPYRCTTCTEAEMAAAGAKR